MGEFPARIVAQDFLTPPELAAWQLAGEDAGRIGGARFTLQSRGGATYLANLYEQIPIRVLPLNLGSTEPTLIYLLNPTNGLMDGDAHRLEIHAGPGTRSVVTGQSATRIHPCLKGFCTQQWRVTVADGAILVVLPGPAIPFAGCRFFQRVDIDLDKNAQLIWGDLWFAGRYARQEASERFRFDRIVQEMRIRREGQLVYRDRFCWHGPWDDETARWHFGDAPAAGTLFATGARLSNNSRAAPVRKRSSPVHPLPYGRGSVIITESRVAAFTTAAGDTCWRWTGSSEDVIRGVVENSLRLASEMTGSSAAEPWLLTGHHLARTHWFDVV
jgi:urease accessory protein